MLFVGLGFLVYAWRRKLGMGYAAFGGLAWIISVALKFAWAITMNGAIYNILTSRLPASIGAPVFYVYVGLLTGVFEVALVWVVLRRIRWGGLVESGTVVWDRLRRGWRRSCLGRHPSPAH